ncbi:hypothetical protein [uncultured Erythrobacter sp.]|uniref:hypothetical protein n=1 Tax=uncultured Erythrobacter sp. TaxID=263913 RepID=UPI0026056A24|nr:hypothetical protein [uncultured Erythrobacter sp.]
MHVHPAVAALRLDPGSQRRSRARMEAAKCDWLASESEVAAALSAYDGGGALVGYPALAVLMGEVDAAREFVDGFVRRFIAAQREATLGEVPLRHSSSAGFARLQLMQSGTAVLSLCVYEPVAEPKAAQTARFVDCELQEMVIAGSGRGRVHRLELGDKAPARISTFERQWRAGDHIVQQPLNEAREFVDVGQSLLVLQLSRTPKSPRPSREYRLDNGALMQQISGDKRASEQLMALSVLGALEHCEALGEMDSFARDPANDRDARWEALRQTLALDTGRGMELLASFGPGDPLAHAAAELRAQLIASHPALQDIVPENQ